MAFKRRNNDPGAMDLSLGQSASSQDLGRGPAVQQPAQPEIVVDSTEPYNPIATPVPPPVRPEYYSFQETLEELQIEDEDLMRLVSNAELRGWKAGSTMKFKIDDVEALKRGAAQEPTIILTDSDEEDELQAPGSGGVEIVLDTTEDSGDDSASDVVINIGDIMGGASAAPGPASNLADPVGVPSPLQMESVNGWLNSAGAPASTAPAQLSAPVPDATNPVYEPSPAPTTSHPTPAPAPASKAPSTPLSRKALDDVLARPVAGSAPTPDPDKEVSLGYQQAHPWRKYSRSERKGVEALSEKPMAMFMVDIGGRDDGEVVLWGYQADGEKKVFKSPKSLGDLDPEVRSHLSPIFEGLALSSKTIQKPVQEERDWENEDGSIETSTMARAFKNYASTGERVLGILYYDSFSGTAGTNLPQGHVHVEAILLDEGALVDDKDDALEKQVLDVPEMIIEGTKMSLYDAFAAMLAGKASSEFAAAPVGDTPTMEVSLPAERVTLHKDLNKVRSLTEVLVDYRVESAPAKTASPAGPEPVPAAVSLAAAAPGAKPASDGLMQRLGAYVASQAGKVKKAAAAVGGLAVVAAALIYGGKQLAQRSSARPAEFTGSYRVVDDAVEFNIDSRLYRVPLDPAYKSQIQANLERTYSVLNAVATAKGNPVLDASELHERTVELAAQDGRLDLVESAWVLIARGDARENFYRFTDEGIEFIATGERVAIDARRRDESRQALEGAFKWAAKRALTHGLAAPNLSDYVLIAKTMAGPDSTITRFEALTYLNTRPSE